MRVETTRVIAGRGLPRRKTGGGRWEVWVDGRWVDEEVAMVNGQVGTGPEPLPVHAPGPTRISRVDPEVFRQPEPAPRPEAAATAASALTERQDTVGRLILDEGWKQVDVAAHLGVPQQKVIDALTGAMRKRGMEVPKNAELPGRLTREEIAERRRSARNGKGAPTTSAAPASPSADPRPVQGEAAGSGPVASPAATTEAVTGHDPEWPTGATSTVRASSPVTVEPAAETSLPSAAGEAAPERCAFCGCTDEAACAGGCWWVVDPSGMGRPTCSSCADRMEEVHQHIESDMRSARALALLEAELERLGSELDDLAQRRDLLRDVHAGLEPVVAAYRRLVQGVAA